MDSHHVVRLNRPALLLYITREWKWCLREELHLQLLPSQSSVHDSYTSGAGGEWRKRKSKANESPHFLFSKSLTLSKNGAACGNCTRIDSLAVSQVTVTSKPQDVARACSPCHGTWPLESELRRPGWTFRPLHICLCHPAMVLPRGNAPRSVGYRPTALLLS